MSLKVLKQFFRVSFDLHGVNTVKGSCFGVIAYKSNRKFKLNEKTKPFYHVWGLKY
jgi:hypothetical protein